MEETTSTSKRKSKTTASATAAKATNAKATNAKATASSKPSASASKTTSPSAKASTPSAKKSSTPSKTRLHNDISSEQRNTMIETAAYFIAESKGFCSNPVDDWLTAEHQIDRQLGHQAPL